MLELAYAIILISALIAFWSTFKKAGNAVDKTIDVGLNALTITADTTNDSMRTYARNVHIMNAKQKVEQREVIEELGTIPTDDFLDDLLSGKVMSESPRSS